MKTFTFKNLKNLIELIKEMCIILSVKLINLTTCKNKIYYSDGFEIITSWFPGFILRNNVSLSLLARGAVEDGVSATQVREFIMTDDDRLKQVVPTSVYENKESIKQLITLSKLKQ